MPAQQQHWIRTAFLSGATGPVAVATALVSNGTRYVIATSANRTSYGRAEGIAITAGDNDDTQIEIQSSGTAPNSITGLGTGAATWVIVNASGGIERKTTPASGDDVIGKCNARGGLFIQPGVWDETNTAGGGGGGSFTAPTGTGFMTTTAGAMNAAATAFPATVAMGGTGQSSLTSGNILLGNGAGAVSSFTPAAGVQTFLTTPSSANLAAALTDETGSGSLVFATSPTLVTPNIGVASATSLAISTGFLGIGNTNVANDGIYLANSYAVYFRNFANNANLRALYVDASNQVVAGSANNTLVLISGTATTQVTADTFQVVSTGSVNRLSVTSSGTTVNGTLTLPNSVSVTTGSGAPASSPANGSVFLRTDGTGSTGIYTRQGGAWSAVGGGGSPGGSNTQVQFNDSSSFGGDAGLTYDKTNDVLSVTSAYAVGGTTASTGSLRLPNAGTIKFRNAGNSANICFADFSASDLLYIGSTSAGTENPTGVYMYSTGTGTVNIGDVGFGGAIITDGANGCINLKRNIQVGTGALDVGGGAGVIGIDNAATDPTSNPTGGGILFCSSGALKYRGSSGTVTTVAPADLDGFKATSGEGHCPSCGTDFALEWSNEAYGSLTVCMRCLTDALGDQPWIIRKPKAA